MLFHDLENLDLSANEAKVYLAALELGETSVERLSKKSGVKRTTVYLAVESLGKKGLISQSKRKNKAFYYAENPQRLKNKLMEKLGTIDQLMPQLLSITNLIDNKPVIRFFDGEEGIKEVMRDVVDNLYGDLYAWYEDTWMDDFDSKWLNDVYMSGRIKQKVWVNCIQPDNAYFRELIKTNTEQLRRSRLIDPSFFKIFISINLYGKNKIAIMSYKEKFGLIIESKTIHDSLLSIHKTMWNMIPEKTTQQKTV